MTVEEGETVFHLIVLQHINSIRRSDADVWLIQPSTMLCNLVELLTVTETQEHIHYPKICLPICSST